MICGNNLLVIVIVASIENIISVDLLFDVINCLIILGFRRNNFDAYI